MLATKFFRVGQTSTQLLKHTPQIQRTFSTKVLSPEDKALKTQADQNRIKFQQHDIMSDIMNAEDRRDGGNNQFAPRIRPDVELTRRDNFPFNEVQPKYDTPKSAIDRGGKLQPVDAKDRTVTLTAHVDGAKETKAHSPYTSFSGVPVGVDGKATEKKLVDNPDYGKSRIVHNPSRDVKGGDVFDQFDIQRDIRTSTQPGLDETAVNRSQPGKPVWQPEPHERKFLADVGVDPTKERFTYRERAMMNSKRDQEYLVRGAIHDFTLEQQDAKGDLKHVSRDQFADLFDDAHTKAK
ncbi:hypothetical protein D7X55_34605 [Corallococcus sp. AB049A]|uniref:hypothetical protein n=1 Tax=Corallococcus sp. AB049A TaxID=2316721 RepID=UPI000EA3F53C|nr:hypothetical protein [Corallococcus sp. AB049A]RKH38382.1 hypothetical protein D7Y23_38155 [Corallococcus sp. AB050B]RKI51244.1 hypothetical protein D7X55_34605 [Corallococcus sp. AB049A]